MAVKTIEWRNDTVRMIDQRLLPSREIIRVYRDWRGVAEAIRSMVIRGAPAIGVAAAMGVALGVQQDADFETVCGTLAATRPTAVNLFWAIERMRRMHGSFTAASHRERVRAMVIEVQQIRLEDIDTCRAIG